MLTPTRGAPAASARLITKLRRHPRLSLYNPRSLSRGAALPLSLAVGSAGYAQTRDNSTLGISIPTLRTRTRAPTAITSDANAMKGTHAKELEGERGEIVVTKKTEVKWTDAPPAHHANKAATRFQNPWPSWRYVLST